MRRLLMIPLLLMVAGCGSRAPSADAVAQDDVVSKRSVTAELPAGVKPDSHVLAMREIMGVWTSTTGVVRTSPDRHVEIEIAGDGSFQTTLWGPDRRTGGKAVFSRQQGHIGVLKDGQGRIAGSAAKGAPGELSAFSTWSADWPKDGVMTVHTTGPDQAEVPMRRTG